MKNGCKKDIFIAKKISSTTDEYGNEINQYSIPKPYKINVQPISGTSDIEMYGEKVKTIQKGVVDYKEYIGEFKSNDLAYLDGITPTNEIINGNNANYRIDAVLNQNKIIAIYFERLPNK